MQVSRTGPNRLLLEASYRGDRPLEGVVVRVHLNAPTGNAVVGRTTIQQEEPNAEFDLGAQRVDVWLPALDRGANTAFTIDLEPLARPADA